MKWFVACRRAVSDNLDDIGGFKISGGPDGMVMSVTAGSQSADSLQVSRCLNLHQVLLSLDGTARSHLTSSTSLTDVRG
jgi:hypothetical protein